MGRNNPELATTLDNLAVVLAAQEKFEEAEKLYRRSLEQRQTTMVASLNNLAMVLEGRGQDAAAERQYKQAIAMAEKLPDTALLSFTLHNYGGLLRKLKREAEAKRVELRMKALAKP
jgi:Tfp pilus assembly protein PilF